MGIDYEEINKYERYQYESFLPIFFPLKTEEKKPKLETSTKLDSEYSKLRKSSVSTKSTTPFSQSRKNTIDEEEEMKNSKNNNYKPENKDQFKTIFTDKVNSPFFYSKKEIINIFNKEEYYLDINENENIRKKYYSKLIYKKIWAPISKSKKYNSLFIFDWDDTLFPTSFFINEGLIKYKNILSEELINLFSILEKIIINILNFAINKGDVYIITNSSIDWFKFSSKKYYPNIKNILDKIKIISARDEYEKIYPGQNKIWKSKAFLSLKKEINNNLVTNIICFGDSIIELEAGKTLAYNLGDSFVKTVKFKENPEIEDLIKQLNLIDDKIDFIYSKAKNLSITIEEKN